MLLVLCPGPTSSYVYRESAKDGYSQVCSWQPTACNEECAYVCRLHQEPSAPHQEHKKGARGSKERNQHWARCVSTTKTSPRLKENSKEALSTTGVGDGPNLQPRRVLKESGSKSKGTLPTGWGWHQPYCRQKESKPFVVSDWFDTYQPSGLTG